MELITLNALLEQAIKETKSDQEAVGQFVALYVQQQGQELAETAKELTETKVMAKKLGEGVKKYKAALTNLKTVLSSTED